MQLVVEILQWLNCLEIQSSKCGEYVSLYINHVFNLPEFPKERAKCKCILWWSVTSSFFLIKILNKFFGLFFTLTLILLLSFYITKPFIVVVLLFYHKELFYVFYEYVNSLGCLLLYVQKTNLLGFWNCSISGMEKQVP